MHMVGDSDRVTIAIFFEKCAMSKKAIRRMQKQHNCKFYSEVKHLEPERVSRGSMSLEETPSPRFAPTIARALREILVLGFSSISRRPSNFHGGHKQNLVDARSNDRTPRHPL